MAESRTFEQKRPFRKNNFKPSLPQKTETQSFLVYGEEKIESLFPVPVGSELPVFQRAIGMATGKVLEANVKGTGFIEIDGFKYPMKENRLPKMKKKFPLEKFVNKEVNVTFYPTITMKGIKILKLKPEDPPFIKVANLRKEVKESGALEVIGMIKTIKDGFFTMSIRSNTTRKDYVMNIFGECKANVGDFAIVYSKLENGLIQVKNMRILPRLPRKY